MQSFLRGWLCRRKWKTVIQDYIRSPHADSMRKRNQVVFSMLEAEAEYVQQLHILVNNFLRPLRMAASSKKPPITHDDVSSIFLNRCAPQGRGRGGTRPCAAEPLRVAPGAAEQAAPTAWKPPGHAAPSHPLTSVGAGHTEATQRGQALHAPRVWRCV